MKNIQLLLSTMIAMLVSLALQAQTKVIERPAFDIWNSTALEIDKIEVSDTATVFYIDAFYPPNSWIRIDSETYIREDGKNDKLKIVKSEGIDLNTEFTMPESGETSFKLTFPPIDKNTTKIDFIESDCDVCFKIWGIYLNGDKPTPIQLPDSEAKTTQTEANLPTPVIKKGIARLSGKIFGNIPAELLATPLKLYSTNIITGEYPEYEIPIDKNGEFKLEIPVAGFTIARLYSPLYSGNIYLLPDEEFKLYINPQAKSRQESRYQKKSEESASSSLTINKLSLSTTDLDGLDRKYRMIDHTKLYDDIYNLSPDAYKEYLLKKTNENIAALDEDPTLSDNMRQIIIYDTKLFMLQELLSYTRRLKLAYLVKNKMDYSEYDKMDYKPQELDKSYYTFLNDFNLNDAYYLYSGAYPYTISEIYTLDFFNIPKEKTSMITWLKEVGNELKDYIGSDNGLFYEMIALNEYKKQISELKPLTADQKAEIRKVFSNQTIIDELIAENDKSVELIAQNSKMVGVNVYDTPDVADDKVFDTILEKYKGKVVFVDFWATWCGPCRSAMKTAKPVKSEFEGKDVVFLYLTNYSSPMKTWQQMIPDIHGDHYRVNDKIWDSWSKQYGIQGIPAYFIYDREGKQTQKSVGFMGIENMRKWILESL